MEPDIFKSFGSAMDSLTDKLLFTLKNFAIKHLRIRTVQLKFIMKRKSNKIISFLKLPLKQQPKQGRQQILHVVTQKCRRFNILVSVIWTNPIIIRDNR